MSTSATESSLFELTYNSSTFTVEHQMLENYTGTAYTTTEGLTDIIGEVKQQAEALNYALIIGGHGTGWNNISDWTDYPNQAKRKAALKTRSFGGLDNTYAINVSSLAQAIETNGIKMQYILFDACYMSNVETAYELKDATNFLLLRPMRLWQRDCPTRISGAISTRQLPTTQASSRRTTLITTAPLPHTRALLPSTADRWTSWLPS